MDKNVLVLGGYGNFGRLICECLCRRPDINLIIAGRDKRKSEALSKRLTSGGALCYISTLEIDIYSSDFPQVLQQLKPSVVIHTCGPFQGQDYRVPDICIAAGSHYIDLADDRKFVCDFSSLNNKAVRHGVLAISGASSVPGLSSVVVDHFMQEFSLLEKIEFSILPGSNVRIGEATLKGILSYAGKPFESWENGKNSLRYGWMDCHRAYMGETLGTRWLANVNIPDLELFPVRYKGLKTVRFHAGHELGIVHLSMALMAYLSRSGWVKGWEQYSATIFNIGKYIKKLGTDCGGMVIQMFGMNKQGQNLKITWRLIAKGGVGPRIPTVSAIILVNHILDGELVEAGAFPCLGMYSLAEFLNIVCEWGIYQEIEKTVG